MKLYNVTFSLLGAPSGILSCANLTYTISARHVNVFLVSFSRVHYLTTFHVTIPSNKRLSRLLYMIVNDPDVMEAMSVQTCCWIKDTRTRQIRALPRAKLYTCEETEIR